jgi:protein phosphatase
MSDLVIPDLSLVVLVGVSGSGKSTFAARHFGRYEVLSSDDFRGWVSDDPTSQEATADAFALLSHVAGTRLDRGRLTVVDATSVQPTARRALVRLAREHDVLPVAVVLDVPVAEALARNAARTDRSVPDHAVRRQDAQLRKALRGLRSEGFRAVHHLVGTEQIDAATIVREPLRSDHRTDTGPFDLIGDVHGCLPELLALLDRLGYAVTTDPLGRPVDAVHPEGRRPLFLGDLVDRGPDSVGVLRLAMGMVDAGHALAVPGNHEHKLVRALDGRDVTVGNGLAGTLAQLDGEDAEFRARVRAFCDGLVAHLVLDEGRLVVAHAGLTERFHNRASGRVRSFALYGDTTGETDEHGHPVRLDWAADYRGSAAMVYGHIAVERPTWVNNTLCVDTGCVFGGYLTALRWPEREIVQVPAAQQWADPGRPYHPVAADSPEGAHREPDVLDVTDVLGRRSVTTGLHGRVTIAEENAAGALEVMSRWAVEPRRLLYLPPTMSPCATAPSGDLLEQPSAAFDHYAADGVAEVICEEKHMGSRAVVLVCRTPQVAAERFGLPAGSTGAAHTRTGRTLLPADLTEALLARVRDAATAAGAWDRLGDADGPADWLLLDAEALPWSLKAGDLLREQYAAVGATARAALPAAVAVLAQAAARGAEVADQLAGLADRTARRAEDAERFSAVYRRYAWDVDGLDGVRLAPFQVLATDRGTYEQRDHGWHLDLIDSLVAADRSGLLLTTRRLVVRTDDPASRAEGERWWTDLTAAGGEGMVVKPLANLVRGPRGPVQPGVKVRGREYLRLIYGPEYTEPGQLDRLRSRSLSRKRSLALREYALGIEALHRAVAREPLWRVHEAVFAVLALESEPVDPRL